MEQKVISSQRFGSYSSLIDEINDMCGTRVPGKFPPHPNGMKDLLISVAIHNLAGELSDARAREKIQVAAAQTHAAAGKIIAASSQDPIPPTR